MNKKTTIVAMITGTTSSFIVVWPIALLIAFATGFCGVIGQYLAKFMIKKLEKRKRYKFK